MYFKKEGLPDLDELIICKIVRITPHSAFVSMEEYGGKEAMLHISEGSSKWVKNIRDFISENKLVVCKILNKDEQKGYIDVSLKRVTAGERQRKMNELKADMRIEKLLEVVGRKLGDKPKETVLRIGKKIIEKYGTLYDFFTTVKEKGIELIDELDIDAKYKTELKTQIAEQLKTQKVKLQKQITLQSLANDGVIRLNMIFKKIEELAKDKKVELTIRYISAPKYLLELRVDDYKKGENLFKEIFTQLTSLSKKNDLSFTEIVQHE